jgi:hypothetical protein
VGGGTVKEVRARATLWILAVSPGVIRFRFFDEISFWGNYARKNGLAG